MTGRAFVVASDVFHRKSDIWERENGEIIAFLNSIQIY